jgi:hypothetical protein
MQKTSRISKTIWLRTDRPVIPTNTADWRHLLAVQNALQEGILAIVDSKRPEFFEVEIEDNWYYIHIPSCIAGVYLIAARRMSPSTNGSLKFVVKVSDLLTAVNCD